MAALRKMCTVEGETLRGDRATAAFQELSRRAGGKYAYTSTGALTFTGPGTSVNVYQASAVAYDDPDEQVRGVVRLIFSLISSGIWEISSATVIPASARRAIFSVAVSSLPSTIVPAWPKLMPGISSMKRPAMNATIGRRELLSVT